MERIQLWTVLHVHLAFKGIIKVRDNIYVQKIGVRDRPWQDTSMFDITTKRMKVLHKIGVPLSLKISGGKRKRTRDSIRMD